MEFSMKNVWGVVISLLYIGLVMIAGKFFQKAGKEASRKFIHIMLSNWWIIAMCFFEHVFWACSLPFCFIIINYISYKKNLISVIERDTKEEGLGTVYYAITLFLLAIFSFGVVKKPELGLVGVLIMGYGDGLAAVIGKSVKSYSYKVGSSHKTMAGSTTMFLVSFIILSIFLCVEQASLWMVKAILLSAIATLLEAISLKGTDNLTVPLITTLLLYVIS